MLRKLWSLGMLIVFALLPACKTPTPEVEAPASTATATPAATATVAPPEPTPTNTPAEVSRAATSTPAASVCSGLSGSIETQLLVGPSEAVGLEPVAVGDIPFSSSTEPAYQVQGSTTIAYQDILAEEWGTYEVILNADMTLDGLCEDGEVGPALDLVLTLEGEQITKVRSEGLNQDYPWSGTQILDLVFPVEEGASVSGEGWSFVLHLD